MTGDMIIGFVTGILLGPPIMLAVVFVIDWLRHRNDLDPFVGDIGEYMTDIDPQKSPNALLNELRKGKK